MNSSDLPETSGADRSVSLSYVRLLTDYCQMRGSALPHGLALSGQEERIPFRDFMALCDQAEQALGDPDLALKVGQTIRPGHYGIHGHAVMSANTLGECLNRSIRYHALVHNGGRNVLLREGDMALMCYQSHLPGIDDLGRFQNELCLSAWTAFARWITGLTEYSATWMSFCHAAPASTELHQTLFRCPILFDAPRNAIAFPATFLDMPNPQANPTVTRIMDELSERSLLALRGNDAPTWLVSARHYIARQLRQGLPTHEEIAAALSLSPNELRNALKKQGLLLTDLLEETRAILAVSYLHDPALSLLDISYLLGFSEQSAFTRAFKRWKGVSPGQFRQARQSGEAATQNAAPRRT